MALLNEINVKGVLHPIVTDDGYYQEMTVGDAEQLVATTFTEDDAPYNFRTAGGAIDIGDRKQVEGLVGGTICWNQLSPDTYRTYTNTEVDTRGYFQLAIQAYSPVGNLITPIAVYNAGVVAGIFVPSTNVLGWRMKHNGSSYDMMFTYDYARDIIAGHKYMYSMNFTGVDVSTVGGVSIKDPQLFDLTQMFGSTIADYIYSLEQSQAGAGVAWFKKLFPKPYYAYNAGELMSVKALRHITRGFNAWDEEWEVGGINETTGQNETASDRIRSKNYIPVVPSTTYYIKSSATLVCCRYDADKNYLGYNNRGNETLVLDANTHYLRFRTATAYGTTYKNDICINLHWDGERDGEYEEYAEHVYELDSDLELRGIPMLSAGNDLYYDGDVYEPDGTVTRKYKAVDMGTLNWGRMDSSYQYGTFDVTVYEAKYYTYKPSMVCPIYAASCNNLVGASDDNVVWKRDTKIVVKDTSKANMTAEQFKTAMSGVYLLYELDTPTTETADPYNGTQIVDDFGTEEFVDAGVAAETRDVAIPVGHNSLYQPNLRAKLEMVPEAPEDDGYYVVYHHNGINEYVSLIIPQELPNLPSEDGTYTLKCTVTDGSATLSFESEV